jgi:hypothetical protein
MHCPHVFEQISKQFYSRVWVSVIKAMRGLAGDVERSPRNQSRHVGACACAVESLGKLDQKVVEPASCAVV